MLSQITIDVSKMRIQIYHEQLNQNKEEIVSCSSLKLMIESENNQTQIVGSKILLQLCEQIFKKQLLLGPCVIRI